MFWYRTCRIEALPGKSKWSDYYTLKVRYHGGAFRMPGDEEIRITMGSAEFEARQILDKMVRNGSMNETTAKACWEHLWEKGHETGYSEGYNDANEDESL